VLSNTQKKQKVFREDVTNCFDNSAIHACIPALADWSPAVKEVYLEANPGTSLSTSEWLNVESMAILQVMFIDVVMVLVFVFIGLYVGSMLRKPSKS
jgi:hypothetical protein